MSTATGANSTALGSQTLATGTATTAIGVNSTASGQGALAIGSAKATGKNAIALGNGEVASGDNTFAAGFNAKATGLNSLAFGNTAAASATDSMAFGTIAQVSSTATNSIALGRATSVLSGATDSVALGSSSVADRMNSISVGSANRQRQIIYVAKGTAGTDAVNVSQLTDAVSAFGSGASVGANGSVVKPAYAIDGNTYNNVGDALAALNASAVQYDDTSFSKVTLGGSGHAPVTMTNVANGALNATSLDAVNGQQLNATNTNVSKLAGDVTDIYGKLADAVIYDTSSHDSVTLGGSGHAAVTLTNVANGGLTALSVDAVNGSQLYALGAKTDASGNITNAFVAYDDTSMNTVTLGGSDHDPVKLTNVANGGMNASSVDAVNGSQLYALGAKTDASGNITNAFVAYDDTSMGKVTLGGDADHAPVVLTNVAKSRQPSTQAIAPPEPAG
ncbi:trimeric autotransporter adhesin [Paraburkholderia unamae]|uniref:hypothetical protein n=1 Tax=Paraburkholderia unamae TaxID=219649 RepID=UPI000DC2A8FE|nr:hypothetical protein [Paraburkholderia unamae]RAR61803.1 trimeric autotransporter adhesin [Paraburkholderia unamae]